MNPPNATTDAAVLGETESIILRDYYVERDFFVSPEGILKLLSVRVYGVEWVNVDLSVGCEWTDLNNVDEVLLKWSFLSEAANAPATLRILRMFMGDDFALHQVTGLAASVLLVWGSGCVWSPWLVGGGAGVALAAASVSATLYAGVLTPIPAHAPNAYFYTDLVLSTALGITLLVFAVLNMILCDMASVIDYFHGPLALVNAGLVAGSAIATYTSVMRRLDARDDVTVPQPATVEQDA